jgi:glutamate 5-kinase
MHRRLWVVKVGSQAISDGGALLIQDWMRQVRDVCREQKIDFIWVTSGAIATARDRIGPSQPSESSSKRRRASLSGRQALSAIGQPLLMQTYLQALGYFGMLGSQVLLTADDLANNDRQTLVIQCLSELLKMGVLPILNENDATSTEEIQFGDNDHLSALVAAAVGAERLILMSDIEGYYSSNPKLDPNARLISRVSKVTPDLLARARNELTSKAGRGGILSKLKAAQMGFEKGFVVHLLNARVPDALVRLAGGEQIGTVFTNQPSPESRERP